MKRSGKLFSMLVAVFIFGCSSHTNLIPVGKGNIEANAGIGGPFITVSGTKIPTPYLTVGANYGATDNLNIDANLHITSLFYKITGIDFGTTWFPILNDKLIPTWGIQPRLLLLSSLKQNVESRFRVYPLISNSAAWKLGSGYIYTGFDFIIPFTSQDYEKESPSTIISPFAGYSWQLGERTKLFTELKWHAANVQSNQVAVEYIKISGHGALTILFSIQRSF